jgi:hypothetical protein
VSVAPQFEFAQTWMGIKALRALCALAAQHGRHKKRSWAVVHSGIGLPARQVHPAAGHMHAAVTAPASAAQQQPISCFLFLVSLKPLAELKAAAQDAQLDCVAGAGAVSSWTALTASRMPCCNVDV